MKRVLNPELDRKILDALAEKYHLTDKREGIHLSTLIGCLTRSFLDLISDVELTDTEKLLFATGYGLQEVMTASDAEEPTITVDGITFRPDNVYNLGSGKRLIEMKSTRAGVKRYKEGDLPEHWITYMKAGCHMMSLLEYDLVVIYIAERPTSKIISETLFFTQEEVDSNWQYILSRRDVYQSALDTDIVPPPQSTNQGWECKNCRHNLQCQALIMLTQREAEKNIKELWPE